MEPEQNQHSSKKIVWFGVAFLVCVIVAGGLYWYFGKNTKVGEVIGKVLPFGTPAENVSNPITPVESTGNQNNTGNNTDTRETEPLFRQLSDAPVAGAYIIERDGVQYARYVKKETGHIFEINLKNGEKKQLSNTTIARVYEALWGYDGKAVVLRYLENSSLGARDTIKTELGYLDFPADTATDTVIELRINHLPDNITAASMAPNGKSLFYLLKTDDGVSGSVVDLATVTVKEVLRNSFSEWLPQLLDTGDIILSTKPSATIPGHVYRYDLKTKTMERFVRNKEGVTALANNDGSRLLFAENISHQIALGIFDPKGFVEGDSGETAHEKTVSLVTIPEKCAWRKDGINLYCGSFSSTPSAAIPDAWYQGSFSFTDTFWTANSKTNVIQFVADPKTEIEREFDVVNPVISPNERYFVFINKKDETLWSLRVEQKEAAEEEINVTNPELTPEEIKDIKGSASSGGTPKKPVSP